MKRPFRLSALFLLVLAIGAGAAIGVGSTDTKGNDGDPRQIAPRRGVVPKLGDTPEAVLAALDASLGLVSRVRVELAPIPAEDGTTQTDVLTLRYDLSVPSFDGSEATEAIWQGNLLAGAAADQFVALGVTPIVAIEGTLVSPSGDRLPIGGGIGTVVRDQRFDRPTRVATPEMKRAASELGLAALSVSNLKIVDEVLIVRARGTVTIAKKFARDREPLERLLGGTPARYEGFFLDLRDAESGKPLLRLASAPRSGSTTVWADDEIGVARGLQQRR